MAIMTASKEVWQRVIDRAHAAGGAKMVVKTGADTYSVLSSNGRDFYRVTVHGEAWICTCPAGEHGTPCRHLGHIYIHRLGEQMKAATTGSEVYRERADRLRTFYFGSEQSSQPQERQAVSTAARAELWPEAYR